jgi:hypothetical protein
VKWIIEDIPIFERVYVREERGTDGVIGCPVCAVFPPTRAFDEPTDADREEMLRVAREIVEAHNAKERP